MQQDIIVSLKEIEAEYGVKILYAVEAGSRVWGYHSQNSDYDVRFIFRRDIKSYLSVKSPSEVIQKNKSKIEFHGWDLYKTMNLFMKSNPSLYEWLYSPIVYKESKEFVEALRMLSSQSFSLKKVGYHYANLAKSNLKKEKKTVKMYLQIIRSLMCVLWMEEKQSLPPLPLTKVLKGMNVPSCIVDEVYTLVEVKKENIDIEVSSSLIGFLADQLNRIEVILPSLPDQKVDVSQLNEVIWRELEL